MEYIRDKLLREIVKYLEICQDYFIKKKIQLDEYYSLTNVKFNFIESILESERRYIVKNNELEARLKKLYYTDSYIYNLNMKAAGK
jgi:hypothetical protein